jgi:large subunit ribosomal protein L7/L12
MAELNRADVVAWLSSQTVLEIAELVKELETKWGVSAAAPVAVAAAPAAGGAAEAAAPVEEKTEFDVILKDAAPTRSPSSRKCAPSRAWAEGSQGPGGSRTQADQGSRQQGRREDLKKKLEAAGAKSKSSNSDVNKKQQSFHHGRRFRIWNLSGPCVFLFSSLA